MHHKNIKSIIKKQLKKEYPNWKRIPHNQKKSISKAVLAEVVANYDFDCEIKTSTEELLGIEN